MSFLKKMTKEFDELKSTFGKGDAKKEPKHEETQYGQPSHDQGPHYGGAPPPGGAPNTDASLPPGWIKQWDSNNQRWYFVEQSSGRTQWEPPAPMPQTYGQQNTYPPPGGQYEQHHDSSKNEQGHSNMGKAAGGMGVGAIGGALLKHAMKGKSSHSKHGGSSHHATTHESGYGHQPMQEQEQSYAAEGGEPPLEGDLPDETRSGSSVSASDKEDVEEAREEYREELAEGDASDIEEAREEYEEQVEETYD